MELQPKETIIIYIRKGETTPVRYVAGIRKADTTFHPVHNDIEIDTFQQAVSDPGEFYDLSEAINAASEKLKALISKAASD
jgi:hypothetical protein